MKKILLVILAILLMIFLASCSYGDSTKTALFVKKAGEENVNQKIRQDNDFILPAKGKKSFTVNVSKQATFLYFRYMWNQGTFIDKDPLVQVKSPSGKYFPITPEKDRPLNDFEADFLDPEPGVWKVFVFNPHQIPIDFNGWAVSRFPDNLSPLVFMRATVLSDNNILFSARGSRDPEGRKLYYRWFLDDSSQAWGLTIKHKFKPGLYSPSLVVQDVPKNSPLWDSEKSERVGISPLKTFVFPDFLISQPGDDKSAKIILKRK